VAGERLIEIRDVLASRLTPSMRHFLSQLEDYVIYGDYLFVHAGLRPGVPLDEQRQEDLFWIREPFLSSRRHHGYRVVHGHTIVDTPAILPNRVGIDTGAYAGGSLTAAFISKQTLSFLTDL
ncbi:MAG: serine/threonine protein phosphatase, partial [Alphaproteobacteria bacterium]|nr:serine/threonine protein phosphatase [Alphaproteobacteria bacterium]